MNKPIPKLTDADVTRFWDKVDKSGGCWLWTACLSKTGYGVFSILNYAFKAHRVSYALAKGEPGEFNVNHSCDNPVCVNPSHLWVGTQQENVADAKTKGRHPKGEEHLDHILTESQVLEILESNESQYALARKYGVSRTTIQAIIEGRNWKHVTCSNSGD